MTLVLRNITTVTEFILLGFHVCPQMSVFIFCLVLLLYLLTMAGNVLILALVSLNITLHKPMYFFLCNLAIIDICFSNITVPNMLNGTLRDRNAISLTCCLTQLNLFFLVGTAEFLLFAVMSVDRYFAICQPLHYSVIMEKYVCIKLIAGVWLGSLFSILVPSMLIMKLTFCFSKINHFFCDIGPLLKNSCTDTTSIQMLVTVSSSVMIVSFLVTFVSYTNIVLSIIKIHSVEGRGRTFSTCSSHALVVTLAYGSCIFMYAKPIKWQGFDNDKKVAILNTIVVPVINPFIYTLRNKNIIKIVKNTILPHSKNLAESNCSIRAVCLTINC